MKLMSSSIFAVCILLAGVGHGAINTIWGAQDFGDYIYNFGGSLLDPENQTYRIEMIIDADANTDMSALTDGYIGLGSDVNGWDAFMHASAADDIIYDAREWLWAGEDGLAYIGSAGTLVEDQYTGLPFYFRWFNAESQGSATEAGIIYGVGGAGNVSGWTVGPPPPAPAEDARQLDYMAAGSAGTAWTEGPGADGWQTIQPIPEPGTIGLFLIGAGVLAYRKRRQAQQAIQA
jgi:hypothetical protein